MKAVSIALFATLSLSASAQNFIAPQAARQDIPQQSEDLNPTIDGIVKQIFDVQKPWQLINPAAPASYGTGEKNVSKDIKGGTPFQASTLTIVGVEW